MVSVIIPVYNVEKYMKQCVESVLRQTYKDLEIILVDDGSTDSSGALCDEYALSDDRITVIHKENGGLSDARNAGMAAAHGEYIYFLDSDDYIRKDTIGQLLDHAKKEKADMVFFSAHCFSDSWIPVSESMTVKHRYETDLGERVLVKRFENEEWFCSAWLHFYRADFLKRENLRFVKGLLYEDLMFSGTAYLRPCRIAALNKQLYCYRQLRKGSIMNKKPVKTNFDSFFYIARRYVAEKKRIPEGTVQETGIEYLIRYSFNRCVMTYCDMKRSERKKVKKAFAFIRRETNDLKRVDCRKLKLTLKYPRLWLIYYRGIRKPMKYLIKLIRT